jgi:hypothetical protein
MPSLFVSSAAAPTGTVRLLVRAMGLQPPPVGLSFDGQHVNTRVVRPWTSLRGKTAYAATMAPGWATLVEAPAPAGRRSVDVSVAVQGFDDFRLKARPLPADIPVATQDEFQVLLVSCYCVDEDQGFRVSVEAERIRKEHRVDLTLLMGDQVYLDIPTLHNMPGDELPLADALERKYRTNFELNASESNFAALLKLAPTLALPDDHEYWNNAPHFSPLIQNSVTQAGRDLWRGLADAMFVGYQGFSPVEADGLPFKHQQLDVGPLSFFFANTRTHRAEDRSRSAHPATIDALKNWAAALKAGNPRRFGVLVTGQSYLDDAAGKLKGKVADYNLPNYADFVEFAKVIDELARTSADVLLLTGDVHWSRVARLTPTSDISGEAGIFEVITSPSSLVTSVGWDQWKELKDFFTRGHNPWPRHSDAPNASRQTRMDGAQTPFWGTTLDRQRGDMLCLLGFARHGDGVQVTPRYFEVGRGQINKTKPFTLARR